MTVSVCLSASIYPEVHARSLPNFLCVLLMARSTSGGVAIRYVLPVLWIASHLHVRLLDVVA